MSALLERFYRGLGFLAALAMVGSLVSVLLGIADRQFNLNLRGLDAYAGYCIAAALFLALPETLRRGDHIRVTLLLQKVPSRLKSALEWWSLSAALGLSLYMAWFAVRLVWVSWETHDVSQGADATPLWLPQIAMAVGCVGLAVAFADGLVARWQGRSFFAAAAAEAAHIE
ncbi:MAG TPA: TRAP transporter small permease subunit [Ideonella sp.]|uniref:TRAP transporter small permease n=1 Tax=Ideonella sp. TaxID=1929293 RepID=UPI002E375FAA|nr:TRAP transporter small permease subunit [Ideonella sp.]HEX5686482.1 TRAP transporter small permease subunit [Ideonella sp.]